VTDTEMVISDQIQTIALFYCQI